MNDFLDNLGKAVNEAACKAIKASGDAVELTKASVNIKLDEMKRDSFFKEIGRIIYGEYRENPDLANAELLDFFKCIDEIEESISEQKIKAAKIKNKKFCVNCGIQLDKRVNYCYSCGAKQPEIIFDVKEDFEEKECCCCGSEEPECCETPESCGDEN